MWVLPVSSWYEVYGMTSVGKLKLYWRISMTRQNIVF
jgi:hypothetical protein